MNNAYKKTGIQSNYQGGYQYNYQQSKFALTMAYVLMQPWEQPYDLKTGLCRGTMFQSLDKPFLGRKVTNHG